MPFIRRLALFVFVPFACCAAASLVFPAWASSAGLDFWRLPALRQRLADDERKGRELTSAIEASKASLEVRLALADAVIDGRTSPEEAAAEFLKLDRTRPELLDELRRRFRAATDEESALLQVREFVATRAHDRAVRARHESHDSPPSPISHHVP